IVSPPADRGPASRQNEAPVVTKRLGSDRFRPNGLKTIARLVFSPDSRFLAVSTLEGSIRLVDASDGRCVGRLSGGTEVAFTKDGLGVRSLVARDGSLTLVEWERETGKEQAAVALGPVRKGGDGATLKFAMLSPRGTTAALAYSDASVEGWAAAW